MRRISRRLATFACITAMVAAMGAFALPAGAAPSTPSQVYVVHGILGVPVDVYVNGNKLLSDFQPKDVVGPLELPPATYTITLKQPGTNTDIFSDDVAVPSGQNLTLIAGVSGTGGGAGTPAYFVLPNDASGIVVGKSRVGVFHAANAPQVDIQLDGSDSGITLDNGESGVADVPVGTYSVGVQVAPSGPVAIGPVDLTFGARTLSNVIAISNLAGDELDAVTQTIGGYRLASQTGGVFAFGNASFEGSLGGVDLNQPIVAAAVTASGNGYWLVASDGGVFSFGDAVFYGSLGSIPLNQPIVGIIPTESGNGYWLIASDGGVFTFGDAEFKGSLGGIPLNKPVVGGVFSTGGYTLIASDGGVFNFGTAFFGSLGGTPLNQPIVGLAPTPSGNGYWLAARDGGVFSFGDAGFLGSDPSIGAQAPVVGIAAATTGRAYWLVTANGLQLPFGDAGNYGGAVDTNSPIVAVAA